MTTDPIWKQIGERSILGLNVQPGELILVRDGAGQFQVLQEMLLAIEKVGATPLVETTHNNYLYRLLSEVPWIIWRTGIAIAGDGLSRPIAYSCYRMDNVTCKECRRERWMPGQGR